MFSKIQKSPQFVLPQLYFDIILYIPKTKQNLIQTFLTTIHYTKHTENTQVQFQQFIFPLKYISVGLPGPLWTAFGLTNWFAHIKNTPDATTLTLHAFNLLKRPKHIILFFRSFPNLLICCFNFVYVEGHTSQLVLFDCISVALKSKTMFCGGQTASPP